MYAPSNADPRLRPDFAPELLPLCDGHAPPGSLTNDKFEQRIIEFAAAYYAMNAALAAAGRARTAGDAAGERSALENLRAASLGRDALEDRCAPEGFYAEPVMDGGRYVDLHFVWAGKPPHPPIFARQFKAEFAF